MRRFCGNSRMWRRGAMLALALLLASMLALMAAGATWGAPGGGNGGGGSTGGTTYDPGTDPYSMASLTSQNGVATWWNAGYTGAGVDVALIDTGVSPVEGLATSGKVVYGPDLSLESQSSAFRNLDTNGHGTFMAGLIAGRDSSCAPYATAPASIYRGIAPDARIVS